jgi:tyrosyl-tRNA synthetase
MLKPAVTAALDKLMEPIRAAYEASNEWQQLTLKAYPTPGKKQAKVKDKGTLHPGKKVGEDVGSWNERIWKVAWRKV